MEAARAEALSEEPSAQSYYEAARYLQEEGRDYDRALNYIRGILQKYDKAMTWKIDRCLRSSKIIRGGLAKESGLDIARYANVS